MLARIHWSTGYDGRDIEFVMGGSLRAATVDLHVIDFNQVRVIQVSAAAIQPLHLSVRCEGSTSKEVMYRN